MNQRNQGLLVVRIVDKVVDPDLPLTKASADADGTDRMTFPVRQLVNGIEARRDLQAQALRGNVRLTVFEVRCQAADTETPDVRPAEASAGALASAHGALASSLAGTFRYPLEALE